MSIAPAPLHPEKRSVYSRWGKRALDLCIAAPAIVILSPLLIAVAIVLRIALGSPTLFSQQRAGLHGRAFNLLKFRTMTDARDETGNLLPDDRRLTPVSRFVRSASLDELPELINVLKGEMSVVGPRPLLLQYLPRYTPEQMRRHDVRPGLTGWAQINGRNAITWEQKFAHDVWYVDHMSFWLDVKIIVITVWKMVTREGIAQPGTATMEEFRGSQERNT
jgi:sugar transferase EpsL